LIDGAAEAKPGRRRFDILNLSSDPNHMVANRDARRTSRPTRWRISRRAKWTRTFASVAWAFMVAGFAIITYQRNTG